MLNYVILKKFNRESFMLFMLLFTLFFPHHIFVSTQGLCIILSVFNVFDRVFNPDIALFPKTGMNAIMAKVPQKPTHRNIWVLKENTL